MANRTNDWIGATLAGGRYQISAMLGEGGMGSVYRAVDRNLDAEVVIKVPRQAMLEDPEFAARFTREIRSLVKLSHPGIVKVTDVGDWDGHPFAVMQYLPGGSLADQQTGGADGANICANPRSIPRWLAGIADALDYVHAQGYVHRDVKPGNILFDAQGYPFLSDFGVAKVLAAATDSSSSQAAMTGTGMVLGTPEYMAPELIMGEDIDGRVDQYALAVTVYEMLCGRRPFEHETKTKLLVLHTTKAPPALTEFLPALPERLSQVVLKGLAKDPNDRYARCAGFALAVAAAVETLPIAPEDRVRVKCHGCGKALLVASPIFQKLKQTGQRVPCPACKAPIQVTDASVVPNPPAPTPTNPRSGTVALPGSAAGGESAARSGTMKLDAQSGSGGTAVPQRSGTMKVPTQSGSGEHAAAPRSSTMKIPSQSSSGEHPAASRSGTMKLPTEGAGEHTAAARGGTMKLPTGSTSGEHPAASRSGTMKIPTQDVTAAPAGTRDSGRTVALPGLGGEQVYDLAPAEEPVRRPSPPPLDIQPVPPPAATSSNLNTIVIGIAASAVLTIMVIAGGVWWFVLRASPTRTNGPSTVIAGSPSPPSSIPGFPTTKRAPIVATPLPSPTAAVPKPSVLPKREMASISPPGPETPIPSRPETVEQPQPAEPDSAPKPSNDFPEPPAPSQPSPSPVTTVVTANQPGVVDQAARSEPKEEWSSQLALKRPMKLKGINLAKLLSDPAKYASQVVVPDGMYCLSDYSRIREDGAFELPVNQSRIEVMRNGTLNVQPQKTDVVEVDPKFLPRLKEARSQLGAEFNALPAILTFWVTSRGTCRLVKADIMTQFRPRYNANGRPDVEYFVLRTTPDGVASAKGLDDEWETIARMLHVKNFFEKRLLAYKNMKQAVTEAQIGREMSSMFSSIMRSSAIANARDQQFLSNMRGGLP